MFCISPTKGCEYMKSIKFWLIEGEIMFRSKHITHYAQFALYPWNVNLSLYIYFLDKFTRVFYLELFANGYY